MPKLSVIIPCYFNEDNIPVTASALIENESLLPSDFSVEYILVDDGSKDNTWAAICAFRDSAPEKVKGIKLVTNVGSHNAILAGMHYATGDCNVILAADLQDPPELIPQMIVHWLRGYKLVIANRTDREEKLSQRIFASSFHWLMKRFALENVPEGGFDLVLFDADVRQQLVNMSENHTHILYLMTWLGYDYVSIPYTRRKRDIGVSRWTLKKKIKLFIDAFVSFSYLPIRLISVMGLVLGVIAMLYGIFLIVSRLMGYITISGWSSMMIVILFVGAFQMIAIGIIGEYVWRVLDAARKRPSFVVDIALK